MIFPHDFFNGLFQIVTFIFRPVFCATIGLLLKVKSAQSDLLCVSNWLLLLFCELYSEDREEDSTVQRGHPGGDHRARTRACIYRRGTFPCVNTCLQSLFTVASINEECCSIMGSKWDTTKKRYWNLSGQNGPATADDPECRSNRQPVGQRWVTTVGR